jgi:hypothetical protein
MLAGIGGRADFAIYLVFAGVAAETEIRRQPPTIIS